jgi:hypothetical protein
MGDYGIFVVMALYAWPVWLAVGIAVLLWSVRAVLQGVGNLVQRK